MLEDLCRELNNWFDQSRIFGIFDVVDGILDLTDTGIQEGQYFRITGSVFNDGVYQYPASGLTDETFNGAVWLMAVPKSVLVIADEIAAWCDKYQAADSPAMSPYTSESFGGYSYSKGSVSGAEGGQAGGWQSVFANRLNKWRKICP